jgi:hypothetical protein
VPEGSGGQSTGNGTQGGGGGDAIISEPESNVSPTDGAVSAGAAVGIALAALVVLLGALFAYRSRRRSSYDRRDATLKLAAHTEDEDDLILGGGGAAEGEVPGYRDDEDEDRIPGTRKVHVLDEDDSLMAASLNTSTNFYRDRDVEVIGPVHIPYDQTTDRNSAIKFVASAVATPIPPSIPPDARRTYVADDTVML